MQIPSQISSRHLVAQKQFSTSNERQKVPKSSKQRPDKAQNLDVIVEVSERSNKITGDLQLMFDAIVDANLDDQTEDFKRALNTAIFVSSLLISSKFGADLAGGSGSFS